MNHIIYGKDRVSGVGLGRHDVSKVPRVRLGFGHNDAVMVAVLYYYYIYKRQILRKTVEFCGPILVVKKGLGSWVYDLDPPFLRFCQDSTVQMYGQCFRTLFYFLLISFL